MTRITDREGRTEAVLNDGSFFVDGQQFGMHGAAENGEIQLRHIRPNRADFHDHTFVGNPKTTSLRGRF